MERIEGAGAVVTGAASGIGLGIARRLAEAGARVLMADVEAPRLEKAATELVEAGCEVHWIVTDVSKQEAVDQLAERAHATLGKVHILCNNAGVAGGAGAIWEASEADWKWVLGVNLMGVVHGLRAFVPRMLEHGEPGHIVNTSSILGLTGGGGSIYSVSKHAVTRLSEGLYSDLRNRKASIGVSVLCPGLVATRIVTSARNRPGELPSNVSPEVVAAFAERRKQVQQYFRTAGMPAEQVGDIVVDAIRKDTFYVLTHPELIRDAQTRFDRVLAGEAPPVQTAPMAPQASGSS